MKEEKRAMNIVHESEVPAVQVNTRTLKWLVGKEGHFASGDCACCIVCFEPGSAAKPPHSHSDCEEAIYILEGEGELLTEGGSATPVRRGSFLLMRKDQVHMLSNNGSMPLRAVCFYSAPTDVSLYTTHPIEAVMPAD